KAVAGDLVDFNRQVGPNGATGEVDVETTRAIIEVTTRRTGKLKQIQKLLSHPDMNPLGKPVILFAPNYGRTATGEEAMPKPFALISSSDIKAQEFFDVLRASGGVTEDTSALAGRISRGEQHVWVSLDNSLLKDYEADALALISQKLKGKPCSS